MIVSSFTLGRPEADLELLDELQMPLKALNASLKWWKSWLGKQRARSLPAWPNVYTRELADTATPTAARMGLEPPRFCAQCGRGWSSGPARRLVGALFSPQAGGLGRLATPATEPPGFGSSESSGAPRTSPGHRQSHL